MEREDEIFLRVCGRIRFLRHCNCGTSLPRSFRQARPRLMALNARCPPRRRWNWTTSLRIPAGDTDSSNVSIDWAAREATGWNGRPSRKQQQRESDERRPALT